MQLAVGGTPLRNRHLQKMSPLVNRAANHGAFASCAAASNLAEGIRGHGEIAFSKRLYFCMVELLSLDHLFLRVTLCVRTGMPLIMGQS